MVANSGTWTLISWGLRVTWISGRSSRTYMARQWVDLPGVPLAVHFLDITRNKFGECIGDDPTSDPSVADIVKQAKYASLGQEKVFTLVDTREGLVTLFSAARPPVAAPICGQEGGMQRAMMVSLDHKRQMLYRETVLRMPTVVLQRMYRTNRVRLGLKRPLDPPVPRDTIEY